jgi:hypothetical protein
MKNTLRLFSIINSIHQKEDLSIFEKKVIRDLSIIEKGIIKKHNLEDNTYRLPLYTSFKTNYEQYHDALLVIDEILTIIKKLITQNISLNNIFPSPNVFYVNEMADFSSPDQNTTLLKKLKAISTNSPSEIFTNQVLKSPISIFSTKIVKDLTTYKSTTNLFDKDELSKSPDLFFNEQFYTRLMKHLNINKYYISKQHLHMVITSILKREKEKFASSAVFYDFSFLLNWSFITLFGLYLNRFLRIPLSSASFYVPFVGSSFAPTLLDIFVHTIFIMFVSLWYVSTPIDKETTSSEPQPLIISLMPLIYIAFLDNTIIRSIDFAFFVKSILIIGSLVFNMIFFKVLSFNYNHRKRVQFHSIATVLLFVKFVQFDLLGFFFFLVFYWAVIIGVKMTKRGSL